MLSSMLCVTQTWWRLFRKLQCYKAQGTFHWMNWPLWPLHVAQYISSDMFAYYHLCLSK